MKVSREEILHIANLADLNLKEEEIDKYILNLQDILNFANIINNAKVESLNGTNGVNKNADGLAGIINVHTIKLKIAIINPSSIPIRSPKVNDAIITGIIASVATIGPIGIEPSGVKQKIASIATKKHTLSDNFKFITITLHQGHYHL